MNFCIHHFAEVELDLTFLVLFDLLGESQRSKVEATRKGIRSSVVKSVSARDTEPETQPETCHCNNIRFPTTCYSLHVSVYCYLSLYLRSCCTISSEASFSLNRCKVASLFILFCFPLLFLLLLFPSLNPISGCCESEGAIKRETQSSQP